MTWAKFGTEFFEELMLAGVSDAAARTHAEAIAWVYRTGELAEQVTMAVPKRLLPKIAGTAEPDLAAEELRDAGLWREAGGCWVIVHHADVVRQSIAAQRAKRERDRKAQNRHRTRAGVSADVSAPVNQTDRQTSSSTGGQSEHDSNPWDLP